MQKSARLLVVIAALLVLAGVLSAAPPTATFYLNSPGSGANLAGVYTSPYTGQINGGPTIPVICDDFADDSYVPEQWTAYQTSLSSVVSGTPDIYLRWLNTAGATVTVNGSTLNQAQAYAVAAVLAFDILQSTGQAQQDYSFALWELFDAPHAFNQLASHGDTTDEANATTQLNNAVSFVVNSANAAQVQADVNAVTIYSYPSDPTLNPNGPLGCGGTCPPPPQEFLTVNMVEPPSPALLGLDLFVVAGLIFFLRRRLVKA